MKSGVIFFVFFILSGLTHATYKELPQGINSTDFYVVDLRYANGRRKEYFKNSVHFEWQQLSQLGEQSRGYLKKDLSLLITDLRDLGLNPNQKIVIIGQGIEGRGEEGRVAYMLIKLGFKNIYISSKNKLLSAGFQTQTTYPSIAKKSNPFQVTLRGDLTIEKNEILALLKENKFLPCIDVRPDKIPPEAIVGTQTCKKISWRLFFNDDLQIQTAAAKSLTANFSKTDRIVLMSEAGLASAAVMLAMRELGFEKAVLFEGGYSGLRALSDSLLKTN